MRMTNWIPRSLMKWTFVMGLAAFGFVAVGSHASAHHPFHHHRFGGCGWGSHYYGGYSSFYSYRSYYAVPSISFGYVPRYYSVNYYPPTYFAPVYYSPVYYTPTYYAPAYYAPAWNTWGSIDNSGVDNNGVDNNVGFSIASNTISRLSSTSSVATNLRANSPLAMPSRTSLPSTLQSRTPISGVQVAKVETAIKPSERAAQPVQLASYKPAVLQPYSPIWTKAAVGIVDEMIAAGEFDHALTSCKSMDRIAQPKGAGVYLRQAILSYFATEEKSSAASIEAALDTLEQACQAGSQVHASELDKNSLRNYFAACLVDVSGSLDKLSESVLKSPGQSAKELLLLSALLKLDGQSERAKLFADEVQSQIASGAAFKWHNLLNACLAEAL